MAVPSKPMTALTRLQDLIGRARSIATNDQNPNRQAQLRSVLAAIMALANHALPDDDPRKLTWEDVEAARDAWEHSSGNEDDDSTLARLARKLASLLPPARGG